MGSRNLFDRYICQSFQQPRRRGGLIIRSFMLAGLLFFSFAQAELPVTGLLLGYEYVAAPGVVPEVGCRLRLESDSGKSELVTVPLKKTYIAIDLEPGVWKPKRLGCGVGKVWTMDGLSENPFIVQEGKLSYGGKWILELPKIRMVERKGEAPEETSSKVRLNNRTQSLKSLLEVLGQESASRVYINAYTTKQISTDVDEPEMDGFKLHAQGLTDSERRLAGLGSQLTACADKEQKADPLRIGALEWKVKYTNGKASPPVDIKTRAGFRDEFINCIKAALLSVNIESSNFELTLKY